MTIRPEDRWKAAILIVLIIAVLGFTAYRMLPALSPTRSPSPAETMPAAPGAAAPAPFTGVVPGAQGPSAAQTPRMATAADLAEDNGAPVPAATRDPFRPPTGVPALPTGGPGAPSRPGAAHPAASSLPSAGPPSSAESRLQAAPAMPAGTAKSFVPSGAMPLARATLPGMELKGIIGGRPPVAVFSIGGQTLYSSRGDQIGANWKLARVGEAGAVLVSGKRRVTLPVGHVFDPATGSVGPFVTSAGAAAPPPAPSINQPNSAAR